MPSVKRGYLTGTHREISEEIPLISKNDSPVEEAYVDQNYQNMFAPGSPLCLIVGRIYSNIISIGFNFLISKMRWRVIPKC